MTTQSQNSAKLRGQDIAYIAVFAAIIIVLGIVSIPVGAAGIPIVMQNAACILAALVLGPRRGALAVILFLLIGLALPVLAGGRTTIHAISGVSGGYLLGYIVSAIVAGIIAYRAPRTNKAITTVVFFVAAFLGLFFQYLFGVFGLMLRADMTFGAAWLAQVPFLGPDTGKVIVMVLIAVAVHAAFPDLRRKPGRTMDETATR